MHATQVRFNCLQLVQYDGWRPDDRVFLRKFLLHKKRAPWQ